MKNSKQPEYRKVYDIAKGLSLAICLPKQYATNLSITAGDFVRIYLESETILIRKA